MLQFEWRLELLVPNDEPYQSETSRSAFYLGQCLIKKSVPSELNKASLPSLDKKRPRACRLTPSEIMTIIIHFHQSHDRDVKTYYVRYVSKHLRQAFPDVVSYTRFVELMPTVLVLLCLLIHFQTKTATGIYFKVKMTNIKIRQMPAVKKFYKKFDKSKKLEVNDTIREIVKNPKIGDQKKGGLARVFVYKFNIGRQEFLLAYEWQPQKKLLLALGVRENFYRDLKESLS